MRKEMSLKMSLPPKLREMLTAEIMTGLIYEMARYGGNVEI
jgi:hypothetical protein